MADQDNIEEAEGEPPKKSKKGLLFGLLLALLLGGGGFYAVFSGMVLAPADEISTPKEAEVPTTPLADVVFVPIQPLVVNIGQEGNRKFLRFNAQLEVHSAAEAEVISVMPRIIDVLNGYLRAVDLSELTERAALVRLRAQMLRRVQVVTGQGRVKDLLIMEFVLN